MNTPRFSFSWNPINGAVRIRDSFISPLYYGHRHGPQECHGEPAVTPYAQSDDERTHSGGFMRIAKMVVGLVLLVTGIAVVSTVPAAATSASSAHVASSSSGTPDGMPYN